MALGEQLRNARLARNETTSQVASATLMMVQVVDDIEREDFSRVSAPIYAKGFIKLYARHVGLDPQPLVDEYVARFAHVARPSLMRGEQERRDANAAPAEARQQVPAVVAAPPPRGPEPRPKAATPPPPRPTAEPSMTLSSLRSAADEIAKAATGALEKGWASMGKGRQDIHEHLQKHHWFKNRPAGSLLKYIPVALGILLIIVFLISSLSRLQSKKARPDAPVPLNEPKEEVRLVIDPPAPYFD